MSRRSVVSFAPPDSTAPNSRASPFDLIVANILAGTLIDLAVSFARFAAPGGRILLSGILVEQADMIVAAYGRCGLALERQLDLESNGALWRTLLIRKG